MMLLMLGTMGSMILRKDLELMFLGMLVNVEGDAHYKIPGI